MVGHTALRASPGLIPGGACCAHARHGTANARPGHAEPCRAWPGLPGCQPYTHISINVKVWFIIIENLIFFFQKIESKLSWLNTKTVLNTLNNRSFLFYQVVIYYSGIGANEFEILHLSKIFARTDCSPCFPFSHTLPH